MTAPGKHVPCKGCGQMIFFVRTRTGASMPLDANSVCYMLGSAPDGTPLAIPLPNAFVSHFRTCRMAKDFSGGGKKKAVAPTTEGQCPPSTSTQPS